MASLITTPPLVLLVKGRSLDLRYLRGIVGGSLNVCQALRHHYNPSVATDSILTDRNITWGAQPVTWA